jgi:3-methyladenine DNA glycosylase Tag
VIDCKKAQHGKLQNNNAVYPPQTSNNHCKAMRNNGLRRKGKKISVVLMKSSGNISDHIEK